MEPDDHIGTCCITDPVLVKSMRSEGTVAKCTACRKRRSGLPLDDIAERVREVYEVYYVDSQNTPYPGIGASPSEIISGLLTSDMDVASGIAGHLYDEQQSDVRDGADTLYDDTCLYVETEADPSQHFQQWREFCKRIRHSRRYFDEENLSLIRDLLGELDPCDIGVEVGPGTDHTSLCRGRAARSPAEVSAILSNQPLSLGPPPADVTSGGRMNPPGIPFFYGGFSDRVCMAEVRPEVGGYVVLAKFAISRRLTILDLTEFYEMGPQESPFGPDYWEERSRWRFLQALDRLLGQPVVAGTEPIQYVPTQAVAEFIKNKMGYDGIVYSSVQTSSLGPTQPRTDDRNVVIFEGQEAIESQNPPSLRLVDGSTCVAQIHGMELESYSVALSADGRSLSEITTLLDE